MEFWRIVDNKTYYGAAVEKLGWDIHDDYFQAPDEYINYGKFIIFRTCHGIGDWVMVERLAVNLKHKYPNCEVYIPSPTFLTDTLGELHQRGWWNSWGDPSKTVEYMFKNNPYIDGMVDNWFTEVYHDHFRIYDSKNPKVTLAEQMLKFHHIEYNECVDLIPMIYFDDSEAKLGDGYLKDLPSDFEFLHISDRYTQKDTNILLSYIESIGLSGKKFVTYYKGDISETPFGKLNMIGNIINITDPRIQFYVKSKANNVIGVQTGATDVVSGLTQVHSLHHSPVLEETWEAGNYIPSIKYIDRKDYL